jgi:hypothetical protein
VLPKTHVCSGSFTSITPSPPDVRSPLNSDAKADTRGGQFGASSRHIPTLQSRCQRLDDPFNIKHAPRLAPPAHRPEVKEVRLA